VPMHIDPGCENQQLHAPLRTRFGNAQAYWRATGHQLRMAGCNLRCL